MPQRKLVLIMKKVPLESDFDSDFEWFCETLGLLRKKDKEQTSIRVFKKVVDNSKNGHGTSSKELTDELGLSKTSVVHHLNILIHSGVIERRKSEYYLRSHNLARTMVEVRRDMERMFDQIEEIAREIDEELDLPRRRLLRRREHL